MLEDSLHTPISLDLVAVAIGSMQGAMFAAGFKRIDLLGVAVIGIATGFGGALLRDVLLATSPAAFASNWYLLMAVVAALTGMLLQRLLQRVDILITIFDALTIGIFGAIGTTKALSFGLPIVPAIFVGTIAAVGGGVIRDLLLNIPVALMHVGSLYAVAALIGNSTLVLLLLFNVDVLIAGGICVVITTVIRLLAVRFGWSLPEQRALSRSLLRRQRQVEETIDAIRTGTITIDMLTINEDGTAQIKDFSGDETNDTDPNQT